MMLPKLITIARDLARSSDGLTEQKPDELLTDAERFVLGLLCANGELTVPVIARNRGVSRQSIQTVMDRLVTRGLADRRVNPAHRRSWLFGPTDAGRALHNQSEAADAALWRSIAPGVSDESLAAAIRTLTTVLDALKRELSHRSTP